MPIVNPAETKRIENGRSLDVPKTYIKKQWPDKGKIKIPFQGALSGSGSLFCNPRQMWKHFINFLVRHGGAMMRYTSAEAGAQKKGPCFTLGVGLRLCQGMWSRRASRSRRWFSWTSNNNAKERGWGVGAGDNPSRGMEARPGTEQQGGNENHSRVGFCSLVPLHGCPFGETVQASVGRDRILRAQLFSLLTPHPP